MKYYVKTDFVPIVVNYLTVGKEYEIYNRFKDYGEIINDIGVVSLIRINGCAHLEFNPWTLVERPS